MNDRLGSEDVIWDLTPLYNDTGDDNIKKDIEYIKSKITMFSTKYRNKLNFISPGEFFNAVIALEDINQKTSRIGSFAFLNFTTQSNNAEAGAFLQRFEEISSQFQKELLFFELEWASLEDEAANLLLENPALGKYRHYLEKLRKYRPHQLTEPEEKILAEISPVGAGNWNKLFEKVLSMLKFGEAGRTEEEVLSDLYDSDRMIRIKSVREFTEGLESQKHIMTHIFNTILADKMIMDRLRRFPDWVSSMNLDNEIDERIVTALVEAVKNRYDIPQRYYRLKKELLGYDELFDYDRYSLLPFSPEKKIPWDQGKEMVLNAYKDFSPQMKDIALKFFDGRWIHAPIMQGKRGGAFSDPVTPDVHPYVMINYSGINRDVQTLAHELGHGVHQYLAGGKQGYFNSRTPLIMAETALVFGEMLVFRSQLGMAEGKDEKLSLLCNKLEEIFATVFRQIAMNRFEDAIHRERRSIGELSPDRFGELWIDTQKEMFGDSVTLTEDYSIWWSYVTHFLEAPGYVYAYAFGELLVLSLYKMFMEEGKSFVPRYLNLLASGGNGSPAQLLADFGVRLDDPGFWNEGLDIIDKMLKEAEELAEAKEIRMSFESLSSGKRIVVIGGVAAGMSAASKARKLRSDIEILVFEKSGHISYGSCGLPNLISDLIKSPEDLVSHDAKFFKEKRDIDVFLYHEVVAIYPAKQSVLVKNLQTGAESEYQYDKLVITTGARTFVPQIKGIDIKGIFTINTLQDGIETKDFIRKNVPRRALIVGAGHIGMEMAEALVIAGMDVTIAARGPDILGTLDEEITKIVEEGLVRNNVMLLKSTSVRELISKNGYVSEAILDNNESINADIVIVCIGMRPNSEIAKEAGIEIDDHTGAIKVNQRMETNVPGIYSAGDCAMAYHQVLERQVYIPLGTTAIKQGKVAGENMVGGNASFKGIVGTSVLKIFDLEVARTGLSGIDAQREGFNFISNVVEQNSRAHYYPGGSKIWVKLIAEMNTGRILGAEMVGKEGISKRIDVFATAIAAKMTAEDIGDLDLSYSPPFAPVWDPVLTAANDLKQKINDAK